MSADLEDEPGPEIVTSALADRPLDPEEDIHHLHEITPRLNVDPVVFLIAEDRVVAIRIVDRLDRVVYFYGFSPAAGSWTLVKEWTGDEITPEAYHDVVVCWIDRHGREVGRCAYP